MAARRLIPLLDRVLVQKVEATAKSAGGLLLPETAAAKASLRCRARARGCRLLDGTAACDAPSSRG